MVIHTYLRTSFGFDHTPHTTHHTPHTTQHHRLSKNNGFDVRGGTSVELCGFHGAPWSFCGTSVELRGASVELKRANSHVFGQKLWFWTSVLLPGCFRGASVELPGGFRGLRGAPWSFRGIKTSKFTRICPKWLVLDVRSASGVLPWSLRGAPWNFRGAKTCKFTRIW